MFNKAFVKQLTNHIFLAFKNLSLKKKIIFSLVAFLLIAGEVYNINTSTPAQNLASNITTNATSPLEQIAGNNDLTTPTATPTNPDSGNKETVNLATSGQVLGSTNQPSPKPATQNPTNNSSTSIAANSTIDTKAPTPTFTPTITLVTTTPSPTPTPAFIPSPTPTLAFSGVTVHLSVNGSALGSVLVEAGTNPCGVLNAALVQGKISSVDIRDSSQFGTQVVYQINGAPKDTSQVWWTYSINGVNPPKGCSFFIVNNNDNISWNYVGPEGR